MLAEELKKTKVNFNRLANPIKFALQFDNMICVDVSTSPSEGLDHRPVPVEDNIT